MHDHKETSSCCHEKKKIDYLLYGSLILVALSYVLHFYLNGGESWLAVVADATFEFINKMWWGVAVGILMIGILAKIPQEFITKILGHGNSFGGILRATFAGVLLDLCSHGILMVAMQLYRKGASIGQVMAFLISSPWNSFSLTIVLFTLIGLKWTLAFIFLSMAIALISGIIFDALTRSGKLPTNPNKIELSENFHFWPELKKQISSTKFNFSLLREILINGVKDSRMVIRWLLVGVVIASIVRASLPHDLFHNYFGASFIGLSLTIFVATILEVCSEGSAPIAADILNRANAPGNSFAFLMTGVSTDYTEIMSLKDTTKSWKIALFLPLITLPQVIFVSYLINIGMIF